jgi:hypothetical protein
VDTLSNIVSDPPESMNLFGLVLSFLIKWTSFHVFLLRSFFFHFSRVFRTKMKISWKKTSKIKKNFYCAFWIKPHCFVIYHKNHGEICNGFDFIFCPTLSHNNLKKKNEKNFKKIIQHIVNIKSKSAVFFSLSLKCGFGEKKNLLRR